MPLPRPARRRASREAPATEPPKRAPGRPPTPWPDPIDATPEDVMRVLVNTPPDSDARAHRSA